MPATGKNDERLLGKLMLSSALVVVSAAYGYWQKTLNAPRPENNLAAQAAPSAPAPVAMGPAPAAGPAPLAPPAPADKQVQADAPVPAKPSAAAAAPVAPPAHADKPADTALAFVTPPPVAEGPAATAIYAPAGSHIEDGEYTSHPQDFQWGTVQIQAQIRNGAFTDIRFLQIPDHRPQSAELTELSKPILLHETIHDQKAGVDIVSTATYTSMAYQDALTDVIAQATRQ